MLLGCNLKGGSSGGPWVANMDLETGSGAIVSVNSYGYSNADPSRMGGPILQGTSAKCLFKLAHILELDSQSHGYIIDVELPGACDETLPQDPTAPVTDFPTDKPTVPPTEPPTHSPTEPPTDSPTDSPVACLESQVCMANAHSSCCEGEYCQGYGKGKFVSYMCSPKKTAGDRCSKNYECSSSQCNKKKCT